MEYGPNLKARPLDVVPSFPVRGYWGRYMVGSRGRIRVRTAPTFDTPEQANESLKSFCKRY